MIKRTIVYIDGFNLYHAIDDMKRPRYKWVNLWSLCEAIIRPQETLVAVKYFSAFATHRSQAYQRHIQYVRAQEYFGVTAIMGRFKKKFLTCKVCGQKYHTHEEKETDVNIGIHLIADALQDNFDRALLISADTDLVSTINMARELCPNKIIHAAAPPGRMSRGRALQHIFAIGPTKLDANLMPQYVTDHNGDIVAQRPVSYDP